MAKKMSVTMHVVYDLDGADTFAAEKKLEEVQAQVISDGTAAAAYKATADAALAGTGVSVTGVSVSATVPTHHS